MQENKNLVEEALIQMKNVEEAIAENAKGILASTMKEEISQLVKESLSEQEELDVDAEVDDTEADNEVDTDVEMDMDMDSDMGDVEMDMDMDVDSEEPIDLTDASDEEILKVFKSMGEEDGIIVKKDGQDIHLTDNDTDSEYLVKLGESEEENYENMEYNEEVDDDKVQDVIDAIFSDSSDDDVDTEVDMDDDEVVYEIEFTEESEMDEEEMEESEMEESEMDEEEMDEEEMDESDYQMDESYSHKKSKKIETKESKMSVKPKGVGMGKAKFTYKKSSGGFSEDKKEGPKTMGTGKAKFEYKEGENMGGKNKVVKRETKEGARTYALGSKEGRGLRKGITPNRDFVYGKGGLKKESLETEVSSLREKNEEYRKALNVFREKLNEVAIFNSNLAYATRLFTEHSTTKKEKINILRRFDNVESLKESKGLYKVIKDELSKTETKSLNETVENKLNKTVQTGSSTTLIESKTYENPQFLRIKDLITKIR
jgi:hypothetical protein